MRIKLFITTLCTLICFTPALAQSFTIKAATLKSPLKITGDIIFENTVTAINAAKVEASGQIRLTGSITINACIIKCETLVIGPAVNRITITGMVTIECDKLVLENTAPLAGDLEITKAGIAKAKLTVNAKQVIKNGRAISYTSADNNFEIDW
jgi:hypothetical protein